MKTLKDFKKYILDQPFTFTEYSVPATKRDLIELVDCLQGSIDELRKELTKPKGFIDNYIK
jgi:hypothetical protein